MASLHLQSSIVLSPYPSSSLHCSSRRINASINLPKLPKGRSMVPKISTLTKTYIQEINILENFTAAIPHDLQRSSSSPKTTTKDETIDQLAISELYMILEAVADRIEMHKNIGEQRDNWNTLLMNSINMITLAAATMSGVAAAVGGGMPILALKLSATLLFTSATGLLVVMNKIQPSQLVEEQRNATKLFKQLENEIKTVLALRTPTSKDVGSMMEKVLALDQAYPLPLLGKMIEKFPKKFEPARWWPNMQSNQRNKIDASRVPVRNSDSNNGWSEELEMEMRAIIHVLKEKDAEDYERLGNLALKLNKTLAVSGPMLTAFAAVGSAFVGSPSIVGSCAAVAAAVCGSLASVVNTLEHGGQKRKACYVGGSGLLFRYFRYTLGLSHNKVGMVFEMYRNCGGFFGQLEESIESTLSERRVERRENGELFEMKVAMQLGRSLSELRDLARKSSSSRCVGSNADEFASKLF